METHVVCLCVPYWAWRKERRANNCLRIWEPKLWKSIDNLKATAHGAILSGRGRKIKIDERLQRRIVRMVNKEPQSTSKQILDDLQTQCQLALSVAIWMKWDAMGGDPGGPHCWHRDIKKPDWGSQNPSGKNIMWTDETKVELFGKANYC